MKHLHLKLGIGLVFVFGLLYLGMNLYDPFRHKYYEFRGHRLGLEKKRELILQVKEGMSEDDVFKLLGRPDEVRPRNDSHCFVHEEYKWAYGIQKKGAFARAGIVAFTKEKKVLLASSPIGSFLRNDDIPFSIKAIPSQAGMTCKLSGVTMDKDGYHHVRMVLENKGKDIYKRRHPSKHLQSYIYIEIYDSNFVCLYKKYQFDYVSVFSFDKNKWPVVLIPPGGQKFQDFCFWMPLSDYGPLAPGVYYVRVAYPFEKDMFYPSNLVRFYI